MIEIYLSNEHGDFEMTAKILTDDSEIEPGFYWIVELDDDRVEEPVQVYAGGTVYEIGIEYSLGDVASYIRRGYGFVCIEPPEIEV